MKFSDIKVGDTIIAAKSLGVKYGWGQSAFTRVFHLPVTVSKVTATEFTAGGVRYKKSGNQVGEPYAVARLPDDVNQIHNDADVAAYTEKVRRLSGNINCTLALNIATDIDVALKALSLIDQARQLLSGGDV